MKAAIVLNKAARNPLFVLRLFGLYPGSTSSLLYICYGYAVIVIFSLIYTTLMVCEMFRLHDWSSTEAFYMTATEVALVVKILNFRLRVKSMTEMLTLAQDFELQHEDEIELLRLYSKKLIQGTIFYFVAVTYAQSSVEISAALDDDNTLPYPAWYPYLDHKHNNLHYWLLYVYQVLGMFITAYVNVSLEIFGAMMMSMNTYQTEVLGMRMSKLGYIDGDADENSQLSGKSLTNVRIKLLQYLKHHQAIGRLDSYIFFNISIFSAFNNDNFRLKENIQQYFSVAYLAQASISAIVLCSIANEMAGVSCQSISFF